VQGGRFPIHAELQTFCKPGNRTPAGACEWQARGTRQQTMFRRCILRVE
jgi:hypothetical protein